MLREISRDSKKTKEEAETKYFMYSGGGRLIKKCKKNLIIIIDILQIII